MITKFSIPKAPLRKFCEAVKSSRVASTDVFSNAVLVRFSPGEVHFAFRTATTRVYYSTRVSTVEASGVCSADVEQFMRAVDVVAENMLLFVHEGRIGFKVHGTNVLFEAMYPDEDFYDDPTQYAEPKWRIGAYFFNALSEGLKYAGRRGTYIYCTPERMIVPAFSEFMSISGRFPRITLNMESARRLVDLFAQSTDKVTVYRSESMWFFSNGKFGISTLALANHLPYHANLNYTSERRMFVEAGKLLPLAKYLDSPGFSEYVTVAVGTDAKLIIERASHGNVPVEFCVSRSVEDARVPSFVTILVKALIDSLSVFARDIHLSVEGSSLLISDERKTAVVFGHGR